MRDLGNYLAEVGQRLERQADRFAPSDELQLRVQKAVEQRGLMALMERYLDAEGNFRWRAGLRTGRGTAYEPVAFDSAEEVDGAWDDAFARLGLWES